MLLRDSMRVVLDPNASKALLIGALAEWGCAGLSACLLLGLLDHRSAMSSLAAGVANGVIVIVALLVLRQIVVSRGSDK